MPFPYFLSECIPLGCGCLQGIQTVSITQKYPKSNGQDWAFDSQPSQDDLLVVHLHLTPSRHPHHFSPMLKAKFFCLHLHSSPQVLGGNDSVTTD